MAKPKPSRKPQIPKKSKKDCVFCKDKSAPDYKTYQDLEKFISDRAKMIPSIYTGTCSKHQKLLSIAVKRARFLGLLPYTAVSK
jgi:small subunit ribosomal protein S18